MFYHPGVLRIPAPREFPYNFFKCLCLCVWYLKCDYDMTCTPWTTTTKLQTYIWSQVNDYCYHGIHIDLTVAIILHPSLTNYFYSGHYIFSRDRIIIIIIVYHHVHHHNDVMQAIITHIVTPSITTGNNNPSSSSSFSPPSTSLVSVTGIGRQFSFFQGTIYITGWLCEALQ